MRKYNRSQRSRAAMPLRVFTVCWNDWATDEDSALHLVVARCPSQAAKVWRDVRGISVADAPTDDLRVELVEWQWDSPEPPLPKSPSDIPLTADPPGGLAFWRGYGLTDLSDVECDGCGESLPRSMLDDLDRCKDCVQDARRLCDDDTDEYEREPDTNEEEGRP